MRKPSTGKRSVVYVYLHPSEYNHVREAAEKDGRSISGWVRWTIISALIEREARRPISRDDQHENEVPRHGDWGN